MQHFNLQLCSCHRNRTTAQGGSPQIRGELPSSQQVGGSKGRREGFGDCGRRGHTPQNRVYLQRQSFCHIHQCHIKVEYFQDTLRPVIIKKHLCLPWVRKQVYSSSLAQDKRRSFLIMTSLNVSRNTSPIGF